MTKIKVKFKMNLWKRIKAACLVWWRIVVTGEIQCVDPNEEGAK